jgi:hypothetical protein
MGGIIARAGRSAKPPVSRGYATFIASISVIEHGLGHVLRRKGAKICILPETGGGKAPRS